MRKGIVISLFLVSVMFFSSFKVKEGKPVIKNISALEYHGHNRNFDILCDTSGRIIVANFEGLMIWNGLTWNMIHSPGISRATKLFLSREGRIWVGGFNFFGYIAGGNELTCLAADTTTVLKFGEVDRIGEDEGGIYFSASEGNFRVGEGGLEAVGELPAVAEISGKWERNDVLARAVIDDLKYIALGTSADGVVLMDADGNTVDVVNTDDGLCSNSIAALTYDGKGTLWGATDNGLFYLCMSPVFSYFGATDGLSGQVTSICYSGRTLYVGTLQGLFFLCDGSDSFEKFPELNLACWQLLEDEKGVVYAATAQGLYVVGRHLKKLTDRHTVSICIARDGTIISGEVNGMYRISPDGKEEQLNDIPNVLKFKKDSAGGIWAVNYLQKKYYAPPDGRFSFDLKENPELNLLFEYEGPDGSVWRPENGNSGLWCENLSENETAWLNTLDSYAVDAMEINGNTAFIGGNFGIIRLNLENARAIKPYRTDIYFRDFERSGSNMSFTASIDRTEPYSIALYSYRLQEGDDWSEWTEGNNDLSFGHLPSGNYSVTVRCLDEFGIISETEPVKFSVKPPFYFKWFAFCFYLIVIAFGVKVAFDAYTSRKIKKTAERAAELEKEVEERTVELKEAQNKLLIQEREATVGKLTRGLIDRILNPMNYINNFAHLSIGLAGDLAENIEEDKDRMTKDNYEDSIDVIGMLREDLEKIEQHGLATTNILKAMEELLKERSGKIEPADLVSLCTQTADVFLKYYEKTVKECDIDFQWSPPQEPVIARINPETFGKTVMSILGNGIYAVSKRFKVNPSVRPVIRMSLEKKDEGGCILTIYDNGIGIEEAIMDKIYDPFFTTKLTSEASGVGLYLCRQSIQDMGGTIGIESGKDEYTKVTVELL